MTADQCQEAKAGDTMKKIQELTALKNQHRRLGRQNSRRGKPNLPFLVLGRCQLSMASTGTHPQGIIWAQIRCSGHPDREINGANSDPSFTSREVLQAESVLPQCWAQGGGSFHLQVHEDLLPWPDDPAVLQLALFFG